MFPKKVHVGDTVYLIVRYHNNEKKVIYCPEEIDMVDTCPDYSTTVELFLGDHQKYRIFFESLILEEHEKYLQPKPVYPNTSHFYIVQSFSIPAIEDLHSLRWNQFIKKNSQSNETIKIKVWLNKGHETSEQILYNNLVIKPRPKKEMDLIENWYKETYNAKAFPVRTGNEKSSVKVMNNFQYPQHLNYSLFQFVRIGNRYPGYPNLPSDWQGWKKLEESFGASTLRDEIRWTRVCLQYCTTGDEKVLDELKSWLDKMNPIQRTVMVNNYFHKNENLPNSKKLYETIQSFKNK
ncbi:MAG: hypothetical protein LBP59_13005 [Planctomycetaceae bacterium]|nr:hypothetical protein [Planctomycetaceae bacterium]